MSRRWYGVVATIAVGALALRLQAIDFGLPAVYNPDEVAIMSRALAFAKGDLNPHNFVYPTFYFYVLFAWIGAAFLWLRATGAVASAAEFQSRFFVDPTSVFVAGRTLSALAGALTTGAVALLGRTVFDPVTGIAAAMLLAVSPLAVQDAHYVKHDVPVTLVITIAVWLMARCWPEAGDGLKGRSALILPAIATGVAWSMHYYTVFLGLPLVLTAWVARRDRRPLDILRSATAMVAIAVAVFFLLSPFLLVEPATAIRDLTANRQTVVDRGVAAGVLHNLQRYAEMLVTTGVSGPVAGLAAAGAVWLVWRRRRLALLLLSFPTAFLLFIGLYSESGVADPPSRYLNPLLPFVALLAAHAVASVSRAISPRPVIAVALTLLAAWLPLSSSLEIGRFFGQADTRTLARAFIESTVPSGRTMLIQPYSVPLHESREGLEAAVLAHAGSLDRASTKSRLRLATAPWPQPAYRLVWLGDGGLDDDKIYVSPGALQEDPLDALRAHGIDIVILKGFDEPDPSLATLMDALTRQAKRLATVSPFRDEAARAGRPFLHNRDATIRPDLARPGPEIHIFEVPGSPLDGLQ
jgi:hypothetical protein